MDKKILVAHPHTDDGELLLNYLEHMGYKGDVLRIAESKKAEEFIKENIHELQAVIISDMLPRLAGLGIARLVRTLAKVPVIIITRLPKSIGKKHWEELEEISDGQLLEPFRLVEFEEVFRKAVAACD